MASLNKVFLIGNLTRDPELRYTPSGTAVVNLRLAVNRRYRDRSGELKDEVCYITVIAWDKQAEVCNQYLAKGRPICVEGRLQSRSWENTEGQKRSVVEVRAERIQFLGQGKTAGAAAFSPEEAEKVSEGIKEKAAEDSDLVWDEEGKIGEKDQEGV